MIFRDEDDNQIDFSIPIHVSPRVECIKCGKILALAEQDWCNTCRRIMNLSYSSPVDATLQTEGCQDYWAKQKAEPIPEVLDVAHWPEITGTRRRLSADAWRQLYAQGYAGIPKDFRKRIRPNVRKLIVESLPKAA